LGLRLEPILKEMQKFGEEYKISDERLR
jgi:hypothetical protein